MAVSLKENESALTFKRVDLSFEDYLLEEPQTLISVVDDAVILKLPVNESTSHFVGLSIPHGQTRFSVLLPFSLGNLDFVFRVYSSHSFYVVGELLDSRRLCRRVLWTLFSAIPAFVGSSHAP